jgi:phosphoribosylformylglycinamidine synthase
MAMATGIGAVLDAVPEDTPAHAFWFGEDQARYVVTVPADRAEAVTKRVAGASVPVHRIGSTGGETIEIPGERAVAVKALAGRFEGWLPDYMSGAA